MSKNASARTTTSTLHGINDFNAIEKSQDANEEQIIEQFFLRKIDTGNDVERAHYAKLVDAIDLIQTVQRVKQEVQMLYTENYVVKNWLNENQPHLLIGYEYQLNKINSDVKRHITDDSKSKRSSSTTFSNTSTWRSRSIYSFSARSAKDERKQRAVNEKKQTINYTTKIEMATREERLVDKRIEEFEESAEQELLEIRVDMEEQRLRSEEMQNFQNHFKTQYTANENDLQFLHTATDLKLESHFGQYMKSWLNSAKSKQLSMRLSAKEIEKKNQQLKIENFKKIELKKTITVGDYEMALMEHENIYEEFENTYQNSVIIKDVYVKALTMLNKAKYVVHTMNVQKRKQQEELKQLRNINKSKEKDIIQLAKSIRLKCLELEKLKQRQSKFKAPTLEEYNLIKQNLTDTENEISAIRRKISVLAPAHAEALIYRSTKRADLY